MIRRLFISKAFVFFLLLSLPAQDFSSFEYRCLGPYRGGRVTAVCGVQSEQGTFYLGATGGGVWKTTDYGTSWKNISDGYFQTPSIGAIAVAQNDPNIVYVGTGSDGIRSNIIQGKGMYKSINGGKSWEHIGLAHTGQIGAVRVHPLNHNIVYAAAIGKAFAKNDERGIFRTMDGGKTWSKILFLSDEVGFSDIEFMPSNPAILYAAAWKVERKPWSIISGGSSDEGGVYKSLDGGKTWSKSSNGLPDNLIGKIDLEVSPADSKIVYALVEAPGNEGGLYKSMDQGESFALVSNDKGIRTRPFYYTNVKVDPTNTDVVYIMATRYYKSENGGKTWQTLQPPHGDNHDMWINPENPDLFIQANDGGANITHNGGKTWSTQFNQPTAEIYQVEVDDQYPYWLYGGQQDNYSTIAVPSQAPYGIQVAGNGYITNTGGCETGPAVPKPGNHNIVYSNCKGRFGVYDKRTGTEKGYYVGASNMYGHNPKDLVYRFQRVAPIHISPHNPDVIYHCSQFVHKTMDEGKTWTTISPDLTAFESSKQVISGSPITRDITGEEFYSTIYSIRESSLIEGLIWVGANDGPIHVTRNGGSDWENVTPDDLPPGGRVDCVEPSSHNVAKAYATILRYQLGDERPYIYKTEDYGKTWDLLTDGTNGIPGDFPVRVVREDPVREGLLYAGTEYGMFISFDDGQSWLPFQQNLPVTPITDLKIHRGDLVISTMGRSFWILENVITLSQSLFSKEMSTTLFQPKNGIRFKYPSGARSSKMPEYPRPALIIDYYLASPVEQLKMDIIDSEGNSIVTLLSDTTNKEEEIIEDMSLNQVEYLVDNSLSKHTGMNRYRWDMRQIGPWHKDKDRRFNNGPAALPGDYNIQLIADQDTFTQEFKLKLDPRIAKHVSLKDISEQVTLQIDIRDLLSEARRTVNDLELKEKELKSKDLNESEKKELDSIKQKLGMLRTQEGIYMRPMLIDQISYLYSMLNDTDQAPGQDAYQRFEELKIKFDQIK